MSVNEKIAMIVSGLESYLDFEVSFKENRHSDETCLMAGFFDSSRARLKAVGCHFGISEMTFRRYVQSGTDDNGLAKYSCTYGNSNLKTVLTNAANRRDADKDNGYTVNYKMIPIGKGRSRMYYATAVSKSVGKEYIISTRDRLAEDFHNFCMHNFKLPLLKEWSPAILREAVNTKLMICGYCSGNNGEQIGFMSADRDREICLGDRMVKISDLVVYKSLLTNDSLTMIVSDLLREKVICISPNPQKELHFQSFDEYIEKYGSGIVSRLDDYLVPLTPLKGKVDTLALKNKRLYPQQAACVNGINALLRSGVKYGFLNEGMGVGKTIQAASIVESHFNQNYLDKNPGKELKDCFAKDAVTYRNIVLAPGHLVEKWGEEILSEIPDASVTIVKTLSQLVALREHGKKRDKKEFYIMSKDRAKLGSVREPIPTLCKTMMPKFNYCVDCFEASGNYYYQRGVGNDARCPQCNGHHFKAVPMLRIGKRKGMVCPHCSNLLIKYSSRVATNTVSDDTDITFMPRDFSHETTLNAQCYNCGNKLWGPSVKPLNMDIFSKNSERKPKWYKISHFKNHRKKGITTAYVLRGQERDYIRSNEMANESYRVCDQEYGPRKVAPAAYIKKYLKGYFDFCILDECHKFESGDSAQTQAAYACIQASKFSLGLTGTLSNGTAASFFYLLFMLDSPRMVAKGYRCTSSDMMKFSEKYGCVEKCYEMDGTNIQYKSSCRSRAVGRPQIKPGISPLLYAEFIMDRSVQLDITDMSRYLPPIKEQVITVPMENREVLSSYHHTLDVVKSSIQQSEGKTLLTEVLQFGLSYPDKPYGRNPIFSPTKKDCIITKPYNFPQYEEGELLPKEKKLVEIINGEMQEDRNCFVYAAFTGIEEMNVTERLKSVIEKHCNLEGRVQILKSESPCAEKREAWIRKKATEGIKVFITNAKCVETGLDFCFKVDGKMYNYPSIIFYQSTYELATMWQASRRAYRLIQTKECRNFWLAYEGTLQTAALEIMAEKQVATAAIQGKFSSDGLAAMAKGVDPRVKMAQTLASNDMSSDKLLDMFDALNKTNNVQEEDAYADYEPPKTYWEVMGVLPDDTVSDFPDELFEAGTEDLSSGVAVNTTESRSVNRKTREKVDTLSIFSLFGEASADIVVFNSEMSNVVHKKKDTKIKGQLSLMDLF